jgi:hypothetical protein
MSRDPLSVTLRGAVALVFLQVLGLVTLLAMVLYVTLWEDPGGVLAQVVLPLEILALALAVTLALLAWQLARRRAWARAPVVVLELLFLPIGYYFIQGGLAWVGIPVIFVAAGCVCLLIAPASRAALGIRE